jgi:DNA polymerase I-like protein with 3'-5' exonuclease and polymerase domains
LRETHLAAADVFWPGTAVLAVDNPERARRRQQAKQFTHGLGYGMGPKTHAARSRLPLPAATTARDRLRRAWPGASRAMNAIRRDYWYGQRDLRSPFGRPYRIPTRDARPVEHRALNKLNQGTARDVMMHDLITTPRSQRRARAAAHWATIIPVNRD